MTDVLIVSLLGLVVTLIAIMTPIIKLNSSITTLNCNLEALANTIHRDEDELKLVKDKVAQHDIELGSVKKDIKLLHRKTDELKDRKE